MTFSFGMGIHLLIETPPTEEQKIAMAKLVECYKSFPPDLINRIMNS